MDLNLRPGQEIFNYYLDLNELVPTYLEEVYYNQEFINVLISITDFTHSQYTPATHWDPEEYSDAEINEISIKFIKDPDKPGFDKFDEDGIFIYNNDDINDNELHEFDYEDCEQIGNILNEDIEKIKDSIENVFYDSSYAEEMLNEYEEDYDDYMQGERDEYYDRLRKGGW